MATQDELSEFVTFNELQETTNIFIWNRNRTLLFLDLYKQYRKEVGSFIHLKKMYEIIARELELKLKIKVSPTHCENRWKVLERAYKKCIDNNKTTGQARRDFEYADVMNDILGKKKNIHPTLLLAADTVDIIKENQQDGTSLNMKEIEHHEASDNEPAPTEKQVTENQKPVCTKKQKPASLKNTSTCASKMYRTKLLKYDILKEMRAERKQYYKQRLDIEDKKLNAKVEKNRLLEERNQLLKEHRERHMYE